MVSKTATTVTILRSQHSLGNKSHNGKKTSKQERNGNATSQMDVRARENLCCSLASLVLSILLPRAHPCHGCRSTPDFAFQSPSLEEHTKFLTCPRCQARAGRGESFCHASPSPSATGEKVIKGNDHCFTMQGLWFLLIIRVVGPGHSYVFNSTGC